MNDDLKEIFIPLPLVCQIVNRTSQSLRNDARDGLLVLTKQKGVRSPMVRADRLNTYIRKKHFGRVAPVTVESLEALSGRILGHSELEGAL